MTNKIYSLETKSWIDNKIEEEKFYEDDLLENPSVRIPVMFCTDTGKSMFMQLEDGQTKIEKAQGFLRNIINNFSSEGLKNAVDFSIVTFSDDVSCDKYFSCTGNNPYDADLIGKSYSSIGAGVKLAANLMKQRIDEYKQSGVEYKKPFLFIIYGSKADKNDPSIEEAVDMLEHLNKTIGLNVFPINIGNDDTETLGRFAFDETFEKYGNVDFENFFNLVSCSVSTFGSDCDSNESDDIEEFSQASESAPTLRDPSKYSGLYL